MIEKIIANGHPGAGTVALDIAIKLGIDHTGGATQMKWYLKNTIFSDSARTPR
ncbi:hypothetical protein [Desulfosarcina cetonica]|uniref:hypothetical protein n=1 Tax=Desulfosarcina cetonica TaxID=90730 RepID=UPI0012EE152A|nr:hypothetical protein [Desulfosarcina cetonica]